MRSAVFRIEDIANHLLLARKDRHIETIQANSHLASDLVETLVSEKRTEYRSQLQTRIETQVDPSAYGTFIQVNSTRLKNVISNLVNNAVEALDDRHGHVVVGLRLDAIHAVIEVQDDGCGIPEDVLARLGKVELSHGKDHGNGIGVASAQQIIEVWGGSLEYQSSVGQGTTARVRLPIAETPGWFCPELILRPNTQVVAVDDDVSIHHIWSERFDRLTGISITHLSTPDSLAEWLKSRDCNAPELFLMDHELLGFKQDGLDLIDVHGLQDRSVLVTSRAQEASVVARAEALGVRIVPKSAAPQIPVRHMVLGQDGRVPIILIDDDHLVRRIWTAVAGSHRKTVYAFETLAEFLKVADSVAPSTPIYIDINLANGERGDTGSEILYQRGFEKIYYATGDNLRPEKIPPWISGVCGKEGPFA